MRPRVGRTPSSAQAPLADDRAVRGRRRAGREGVLAGRDGLTETCRFSQGREWLSGCWRVRVEAVRPAGRCGASARARDRAGRGARPRRREERFLRGRREGQGDLHRVRPLLAGCKEGEEPKPIRALGLARAWIWRPLAEPSAGPRTQTPALHRFTASCLHVGPPHGTARPPHDPRPKLLSRKRTKDRTKRTSEHCTAPPQQRARKPSKNHPPASSASPPRLPPSPTSCPPCPARSAPPSSPTARPPQTPSARPPAQTF